MADNNSNRDLVLAPGEFAYIQDTTKGLVNTIVGPYKVSMSNTDQPVTWQGRRLGKVDVDKAIQINTIAPEGYYIELLNPAEKHPKEGSQSTVDLQVGNRVNIPGPANFALWPGQMVTVIPGHHLRSNQYLVAQVYNDKEARENWKDAVVKPVTATPPTPAAPRNFTPGQLLIIKGTEVAFFIPPTGIKIVPENGQYVREAITLERLEYCILLDEDGNKRFISGPDVVFPKPTECFVEKPDADGGLVRKFKAIDLNTTTGIYVKVIADYFDAKEGEQGESHKAGDELFITGKEQAIYFQREEHSIIRYGDQTKHYAVAVPSGEGRYVLDRTNGNVALVKGPAMLLPDPRSQVIVRRILAESTAALWYPGNTHVVDVNRALAAASRAAQAQPTSVTRGLAAASLSNAADDVSSMNYLTATPTSRQIAGDVFNRGDKFTPPRMVTLDTKYDGAVSIAVWTGYAVLVISKAGHRRVVVGPENVLLEYDETLAPLELSTGKPKSQAKLLRTVYLNVTNNVVSDVITVETKDLVQATLTMAYRVNFEGDNQEKWFAVENYVRLLTDHMRSLIRNTVKRVGIEAFYGNPIDLIRDAILGKVVDGHRRGRQFEENGMRVYDVEVLDVTIANPAVAQLLGAAQLTALKSAIQISEAEQKLATAKRAADITRETVALDAETATAVADAAKVQITADMEVMAADAVKAEMEQAALDLVNTSTIAREQAHNTARIATKQQEIALFLQQMKAETDEIVARAGAVNSNLTVALTTFADSALVERISTALAPMAAMSGVSAVDILGKLFKGTPLAGVLETLGTRTRPVLETTFVAPEGKK